MDQMSPMSSQSTESAPEGWSPNDSHQRDIRLPSIAEGFGWLGLCPYDYSDSHPCTLHGSFQEVSEKLRDSGTTSSQSDHGEYVSRFQARHVANYKSLIVTQLLNEEAATNLNDIKAGRLFEIFRSTGMDRPYYTVNMLPSQKRKENLKQRVQDPVHAEMEAKRRVRQNDFLRDLDSLSPDIAVRVGRIAKNTGKRKSTKYSRKSPSKDDVLSRTLAAHLLADIILENICGRFME